ncbi:hypothetical protein RQP46_000904 [Phenoliferia psychrophenolica]
MGAKGKWSLYESIPEHVQKVLDTELFDSEEGRTAVIKLLADFVAAWDKHIWVEPLTSAYVLRAGEPALRNLDAMLDFAAADRTCGGPVLEACMEQIKGPLEKEHARLFLYAGASLAQAGTDYPKAEEYLKKALEFTGPIGPQGCLWGMANVELAVRKQGKELEADVIESTIVKHVQDRPTTFSPPALRSLCLSISTLARLGVSLTPGPGNEMIIPVALKAKPSYKGQDRCANCQATGTLKMLMVCARCHMVKYCSPKCQKLNKARHENAQAQRSKLEEDSLVPETRENLTIADSFHAWCHLLKDPIQPVCISAFNMNTATPLHKSHILLIQATFVPDKRRVVDRFRVNSADVLTNAEYSALATARGLAGLDDLDKEVAHQMQIETEYPLTPMRAVLAGSKKRTGPNNAGFVNFSTSLVGEAQIRRTPHDADWFKTLQAMKMRTEYQF